MPKVSVIIPIYNVEPYLERCMHSVQNQTLTDVEIILVDDGSPDNCPQMCDDYARHDSRVKVVHKQNAGLGFARNSGLDIAAGEYIAFVDSDDYVDTKMYETLYAYATKHKADAVFCGLRRSYDDKYFLHRQDVKEETLFEGRDACDSLAFDFIASAPGVGVERKYEMSVWHSIYKRTKIEENNLRFYSERDIVSEDLPFQVAFLRDANKVCFIPDILYTYCMNNSTSLTNTFKFDKVYGEVKLFHLLESMTTDIDIDGCRAKRFIIGYMRSMANVIVLSKCSINKKREYLMQQSSLPLWQELKGYKASSLPLYACIFYFLQSNKYIKVLMLYCHLLDLLRSIKAKLGGESIYDSYGNQIKVVGGRNDKLIFRPIVVSC